MEEKVINAALLGLGTVGTGVYKVLKKQEEEMTFLTKEQVIELFKNFEIIDIKEVEKDCFNGLGIMKHRHIFNVIAKKL